MTKSINDELQRTARQALVGLQPLRPGEEPGGLPFRRLLAAVFRARYLVFATALFGFLVGTFLAITTANSFVSTGKFLLTGSGAEATSLDPSRSTEVSQEAIGSGATYVLSTDGLLKRVVEEFGPANILAPYQPLNTDGSAVKAFFYKIQRDWNATREEDLTAEEALKRLRRTIVIERPRNTRVLVATCAANDPKLAQEILATYLKLAVAWHIEKYEDTDAYDKAKEVAEDALAALQDARGKLDRFLVEHELDDFDDQKLRLQDAVREATTRARTAEDELRRQRGLLALAAANLEGEDAIPRHKVVKRKLDNTSVARERLGEQLADLETRRTVLAGQLADPNNPRLLEVVQQIKDCLATMERLRRESADAEEIEEEIENPEWLQAVERRNLARQEVARLEEVSEWEDEFRDDAKADLQALLELEPEYRSLNSNLETVGTRQAAAARTWEEAQRKHELGLGRFSSLRRFEDASRPLEKEAPNRGRLILGSTLVGLFLGLGLVLLLALPDRVVRTRDDLEDIEGLGVIGVMPRLDAGNLKRHAFRRRRGW